MTLAGEQSALGETVQDRLHSVKGAAVAARQRPPDALDGPLAKAPKHRHELRLQVAKDYGKGIGLAWLLAAGSHAAQAEA